MRGIFLPGGRRVEIRDRHVGEPGYGEVRLSMRAAGLCGSDLHMHYRPAPELRHGPVFGLRTDPDIVPGHEPAGVVESVGTGVDHLRVGDRVAVHHMAGCGHCVWCRRGWDINCRQKWGTYGLDRPGAMQDAMIVRARDCVRVPDNVTMAEASYYTCGAGTGYLALTRAGFAPQDVVTVVGLGPVGLAAAYFAALSGALVIGFDPIAQRRKFAADLGIQYTFDPAGLDAAAAVADLTAGAGASIVIESSGASAGRLAGLEAAGIGARMVLVGFADPETTIDVQQLIIQKQMDVRGAWMFPITQLQDMLDDVSRRNISIESLITGRYSLDDAADAWRVFDRGALGKTLITWVN
ncbi:alcohol dehydrogenase catalytic domain-containing protein [Streptomyces sp. NPDC058000]|uniref:alcohol dehydrogenase catalytic domain-containing protein n=1 Tax=Streptomyces sp. NPDC058000 TaxID=3346299 RepID=UPI0036E60DB9